jgi:hypothetical protein
VFGGGACAAGHAFSSIIAASCDRNIANVPFNVAIFSSFAVTAPSSDTMASARVTVSSTAQRPSLSRLSGGSCAVPWACAVLVRRFGSVSELREVCSAQTDAEPVGKRCV